MRPLFVLLLCVALVPLAGCGSKLHPVTGTVTLDGKPVAEAAVTMTSDDGKYIATGLTDDNGNFTITHASGAGAFAGNYKVTVTKYPKVEGTSPSEQGKADKDYLKAMKKEADAGKGAAPNTPMPGGAKMGGMKMMPPGGGPMGSGAKSELPEVYATTDKTPLTVTVPTSGPVKLELKSK